jgi:DNA polymerase-3 subunit beta
VAARSPLPITSNVLIQTEAGRLKLVATNLEITMVCWIDAEIEEEGAITVPSRLLTDFVSSLPNDKIEMTVAARSRQMKVTCARNEASIGGLDADDFPPIPKVADGVSVTVDPKSLRQAIGQTAFTVATDDSRPVLTGVLTQIEDKQITLAASDGFRLSVYKLALDSAASEKADLVIPGRALSEVQRLLGEEAEPVLIQTNAAKTQVLIKLQNAELIAQLLQGTFPNFSQLIPASWTTRAIVEAGDFLRETRIATVFARDGSGIVRLVVSSGEGGMPGKVVLSARAEEVGDNEGEIDAVVEGEGVKIAFNGKYLVDVLQAMDAGQIALETTNSSSQGVIKPIGSDGYIHVIMPMFVQW